jgi:hypothetical protein
MITIPDPIKKYFKIINEETLIIGPPLSKMVILCAFVFGIPLMSFFIGFHDLKTTQFSYWVLCFFTTLVCFGFGYFIALPGLRGRVTIDLKNRIIHTAYGRHLEFKEECSFDNAEFSFYHDFIVSGDSAVSFNRVYFHDTKYKEVYYELSLKGDTVEYEIMKDFLEEICKPATTLIVQEMQEYRIKETLKNATLTNAIPDGNEMERNKFDKLLD